MADHKGHPLPGSDEARHDEIPEHMERDKGRGDDSAAVTRPAGEAVTPAGERYRYDVAEASRPARSGRPVDPGAAAAAGRG